jgi:CheY-like chemotaxis protein
MRALVIDDSADFRLLASRFIRLEWPEAAVTEHDPATDGEPPRDFPWSRFDVILLDYDLGGPDGISWLRKWPRREIPPVIMLTGAGNEDVAVRALKSGAVDYVRKDDLSRKRLGDAIREAVGTGGQQTMPAAGAHRTLPIAEIEARSAGTGVDALRISGYRTLRKLGEGSSASVYLCESAARGGLAVLKVLDGGLSQEREYLARFIAEYGIVSSIDSPHVVRIYDQGFTSEHAFLAMEYLSGGDLKARLDGALPPATAMRYFSQIAKALIAIHAAGIVHRDLKPQNILFRDDDTLAIADFGIARNTLATRMTLEGEVLGTPLYMSPEQARGLDVDARSDLYGAGVILYHMLAGRPPFSEGSPLEILFQHCNNPPPPLPAALAKFEPLVGRLLAKDPSQRPASARELLLGG